MTEEYIQSMIRQLPIGYAYHRVILDDMGHVADLIFLEANRAYEIMTGLDTKPFRGRRIAEIFGPDPAEGFGWASCYQEALRDDLYGEKVRCAQFGDCWYKVTSFSPERGSFVVMLQDMTQEMRNIAELERQKNEIEKMSAELAIVFNSTSDAMFLVRVDGEDFRYIRSNATHQRLTGYRQEELTDRTPAELLGEELGLRIAESYRRCAESGETVTYEETLPFRGGTRDWLTSLTPVQEKGAVRYLVGSRTDVTAVKRLEREQEELLRRLQSMFTEHSASMLLIEPASGRILDANPSACLFYGYEREELLTLRIQDINMLPTDEVDRRRRSASEKTQKYFLFPHRLKSGEIRLVDVYSSPVSYDGKTVLFSVIFDVTDREKYRDALSREKEMLRITLHSIGDGVITTDNDGRVTSLNKAAEEITGWLEADALERPFSEIIRLRSEETGNEVANPIGIVLKSGKMIGLANHTVLIRKDGRPVPVADSAAPIRNETDRTFGVVMVFRDVSRDKEQQRQILYLSYHDPLTGLYNRRFLEEQMRLVDTERQLPLSIIMGDVNGLKITNDVFGHAEGDRLLQKVAETLRDICRREDVIARWGGDEFLILLPRTAQPAAEEVIERAKQAFREKSEGTLQLSVSLGCSTKTKEEEELQLTLRQAEEWMYHQKLLEGSSYRNAVISTLLATLYEKSMETEAHAERLKDYCQAVGKTLKMTGEELNELALLAVLHDIGKVGIPEAILQKPGPLTPPEWTEMRRHSEIGYRIAQSAPELSVVAEYILSHHERWDGEGYPRKLKGEEIPLFCRILAVADAYDAMTNDRVYRKALPQKDALAELSQNAGTQFDPMIVELFVHSL